jgi:hypothetical protein
MSRLNRLQCEFLFATAARSINADWRVIECVREHVIENIGWIPKGCGKARR